ncbi:MAG TPA: hypothetical protein VMW08_00185 [Acidimicrobiales bacterium]|nr:hypothetical protein [Acidimicrobiales bacterium]
MILADHNWWHAWGELTVWFAGFVTALGLLSRTKPARWLWRQVVSEPITEWFRENGGEIIEEKVGKEFASNGGASLRDAIDGLKSGQDTLTEWTGEAQSGQQKLVDGIEANRGAIVEMSAGISTTLSDHGGRITSLETRHSDVMEAIERLHKCVERRLGGDHDTGDRRRDEDAEVLEEAEKP